MLNIKVKVIRRDEQMEDADLLAEGLREEDRVGTGIDRPLESTSASLFERGTALTANRHININRHQQHDSQRINASN